MRKGIRRSEDLRVVKTRRCLRDAMLKLLKTHELGEVTVADIADEALVNRKTFYKHYADKYQLSDELVSDAADEFGEILAVRARGFADVAGYLDDVGEAYRELFARRDELLSLWDVRTDGGSLKDNLAELLERAYRSLQEDSVENGDLLDFEAHLFAELVLSSLRYLLESGKEFSVGFVTKAFRDMMEEVTSVPERS